jgi:glycosyltransferase involved in cell wall biosynthesis
MTDGRLRPPLVGPPLGYRPRRGESSFPAVCFVAPNAYPALSGREDLAHGGGAERQQVLLAEELERRGHPVSFVVFDHGQPTAKEIRGIRVFTCYQPESGLPKVRFFHPRLSGLWGAMKRARADVYYQRGAGVEAGLVGHWCRLHGRAFVFAAASDTDCMARLPMMSRRSERLLFRYGLRLADAVIAQTSRQQDMLRAEFGVTSTVIQNCFAWRWNREPSALALRQPAKPLGILWAGRLSEEKRPEWMLQLARELPDCRFDMVGHCDVGSPYGRRLVAQIESLPNLQWHGYVPYQKMREIYENARLLLCTSPAEGFPNVFLEAWSCGKGVLTTVDPDGLVAGLQAGEVAPKLVDLKRHLMTLDERRAFWEAAGWRGRQYVQHHRGVPSAGEALAGVIMDAVVRSRRFLAGLGRTEEMSSLGKVDRKLSRVAKSPSGDASGPDSCSGHRSLRPSSDGIGARTCAMPGIGSLPASSGAGDAPFLDERT